jgi:hypothetical protein
LQDDGLDVELIEFGDATHGFDEDYTNDPRTVLRPDLADHLRERYAEALRRALVEAVP